MKIAPLEERGITSNRMVLGCMGFGGSWDNSPFTEDHVLQVEQAIDAALSIGITMFDHADIYRAGKAESVFGEVLKKRPELRDEIILQSKCGIRFSDDLGPGRYDFSKQHIMKSVDGILSRLGTDYIDILLLHRPDPLMEPDEVAHAFSKLKEEGKVRHFGVSNMNAAQMELIQSAIDEPLVANQIEMNLHKLDWVENGVLVNQQAGVNSNFPDRLLEYCQLENIQIQAWSPLAKGIFTGREIENPTEAILQTRKLVEQFAEQKATTKEAIVLGWLMKHPAKIQPVIGTTNAERIKNCKDAVKVSEMMTREEWYSLYVSSRGVSMP
ncbi:aldo/keto reductase [Salirhabdus salicampi]|uniref:aldo/keto reductase n=1 Tax=Salirhabdus salicampi TaxID=476102 RepID=UPI0020C539FE|nr:aldo/keto reductase [Salirhabdus salicampi]MCP8615368.1 aldo/keto reductase [Salirhabdus salicampi]